MLQVRHVTAHGCKYTAAVITKVKIHNEISTGKTHKQMTLQGTVVSMLNRQHVQNNVQKHYKLLSTTFYFLGYI